MRMLFRPATAVWATLMIATCASTWWLAKEALSPSTATLLIMLIAALKARLILIHFMGLGHAPLRWRLLFEAWIVVCTGAVLAIYFY